jgi:hypothetical protein
LKFCGIGLAVGLALGTFVTGLFEVVDDRLYNEKEIKKLLPAPVICEIPVIMTLEEETLQKKKLWMGWAFGIIVVGLIASGSLFSYFRG